MSVHISYMTLYVPFGNVISFVLTQFSILQITGIHVYDKQHIFGLYV